MREERSNWKRWGSVAPHTTRDLARHEARILALTAEVHRHLDSRPERALASLVKLCRAYRSLATFSIVNMAGSLFIGSGCAARVGRKRAASGLDKLGNRYLNRALWESLPEAEVTLLGPLDALGILTPKLSSVAKELKRSTKRPN